MPKRLHHAIKTRSFTRSGLVVWAVIFFAVGYMILMKAFDTGSYWYYLVAIIDLTLAAKAIIALFKKRHTN